MSANIKANQIISENITVTNLIVNTINGRPYHNYYDNCEEPNQCNCVIYEVGPTGPTGHSYNGPTGPTGESITGPTGYGYTGVTGPTGESIIGPTGPTGSSLDFSTIQTYLPVLKDSTGHIVSGSNYRYRIGQFIQVGNLVWFQGCIAIGSKSDLGISSNTLYITLPVVVNNSPTAQSLSISNYVNMLSNISWMNGQIVSGTNIDRFQIPVKVSQLSNNQLLTVGDIAYNFELYFGGFYFT